jgi:hypothetical protein
MERKEFMKRKFRAFEAIEYHQANKTIIECMIMQINFVEELLLLEPIDKELYSDESFWARCENCFIPKPKLKIIK